MNIKEHFKKIYDKLEKHEKRLKETTARELFRKFFNRKINFMHQRNAYFGIHLALCVDTRDPLKQNRVKYFSPVLDIPLQYSAVTFPDGTVGPSQATKISELDWAYPISSMGGFDDTGLSWVPPAGSM